MKNAELASFVLLLANVNCSGCQLASWKLVWCCNTHCVRQTDKWTMPGRGTTHFYMPEQGTLAVKTGAEAVNPLPNSSHSTRHWKRCLGLLWLADRTCLTWYLMYLRGVCWEATGSYLRRTIVADGNPTRQKLHEFLTEVVLRKHYPLRTRSLCATCNAIYESLVMF